MKVAVFLDYANVNAASLNLNCSVDYGELLNYLADEEEDRFLAVAYAYVPIDPRQEHAMDSKIDELWQQGYIVKSKVGAIAGESYKCDFDVEMTMDICRVVYESSPDVVVLVSGDKDFIPVVLEMRGKCVRVEVAAFDSAMARELALKSNGYINLDVWVNGCEEIIDEEDLEEESFEHVSTDDENIRDEEQEESNSEEREHGDSNS